MVKIVNAMTVKQELGNPRACAHLLGHPDHYTNYKFGPFYWRMFVKEVKRAWDQIIPDNKYDKPSVMLARQNDESDSLVALSPVVDYELRPPELQQMALYDWIRLTEKEKIPKSRKIFPSVPAQNGHSDDGSNTESEVKNLQSSPATSQRTLVGHGDEDEERDNEDVEDEGEGEGEDEDEDNDGYSSNETLIAGDEDDEDYIMTDTNSDETDDEDLSWYDISKKSKAKQKSNTFEFSKEQPQYKTHRIRPLPEKKERIPSFIDGILPRRDKGDHEEYCRTMLTLFKPWTDPLSLKLPDQT